MKHGETYASSANNVGKWLRKVEYAQCVGVLVHSNCGATPSTRLGCQTVTWS